MDRALIAFGICIGLGISVIILSTFISALQDYLMIIVALAFLLAGTSSVLLAGFGLKNYLNQFAKGIITFIPGVLVILMASSVRYTLEYAKVMDTILNAFVGVTTEVSSGAVVIMIYVIVLFMNFLIPSASAKAFLLMPLIAPIAQLSGVSLQVAVLAFAFGDGFLFYIIFQLLYTLSIYFYSFDGKNRFVLYILYYIGTFSENFSYVIGIFLTKFIRSAYWTTKNR